MITAVPKESEAGERRTALVPRDAKHLSELGARVLIEAGLGEASGFADAAYEQAGATVAGSLPGMLAEADVILGIHPPALVRAGLLRKDATLIAFLDPFRNLELIERFARQGVNAVCLEFIPRSSRAQGMDAVTSQANLAGYVAVLLATQHLRKAVPMMTTAAGTVPPAKVLVIGAGVAGLQAIATARRLGASVEAFDVRPEVADEIRSLGARFVKIDLGEAGRRSDGYAAPLAERQSEKLRAALARHCAEADIVLTAAQVFGRRAPVLLGTDTLHRMSPGSVVVDLAAESGGNVEGVSTNSISTVGGVSVITWHHLESRVPETASSLFSANVTHFIETFWNASAKSLALPIDDEIIKASLVTRAGRICHERLLPNPTTSATEPGPRRDAPTAARDRSTHAARSP